MYVPERCGTLQEKILCRCAKMEGWPVAFESRIAYAPLMCNEGLNLTYIT